MQKKILFLLLLLALSGSCAPSNQVARQPEKPSPPQDAYYLFMLGYNAEKEGKWEEAITYYNKALQLDPASSSVKTQISYVLLRTGKIKEALSMAEDTIKTDPDYVPALMLLGELYNSQKRSEDSIKIYKRILVIEPDNQEAALFLGLLYASLDQHAKATETLERIEELDARLRAMQGGEAFLLQICQRPRIDRLTALQALEDRVLLDDAQVGDGRYRSVLPLVFLVSWNEHIEGSAVEWTDEHGYGYLMAAARTFR